MEWYYRTIAKYVADKGKVVKGYEMYSKTQALAKGPQLREL